MPKQLDSMLIEIKVLKDSEGDVASEVTSYITLSTSEYPDMADIRKRSSVPITSSIETLATNLAIQYLSDELVSENAEDNIPIPD
jgi:hypothetical protein